MPAGVGYLTRPASGCLGYQIFIRGAVPGHCHTPLKINECANVRIANR